MEIHLELILANTNHTHPPRGVSTNDFANLFNAELKDINIVEAEASRIKIIQSFYKRRGYAQISTDLLNYITNNAKSVVIVKLICYIAKTIKFNSNKIILKEVGIMLDSDGRVILDKSINYGKQ